MKQNKIVIGLTGSIATGKSTVSFRLKELGYFVIDADRISRDLTEPGSEGFRQIILAFGSEYCSLSGELDRKKLSKAVFRDENQREKLNAIMHPLVFHEIHSSIRAANSQMIFADIPLLFEVFDEMKAVGILFDETVLVYTTEALQLQRLIQRDQIDRDQALAKIRAQWSIEKKRKYASYIIDNTGDLSLLYDKVDEMLFFFEQKYFMGNME